MSSRKIYFLYGIVIRGGGVKALSLRKIILLPFKNNNYFTLIKTTYRYMDISR